MNKEQLFNQCESIFDQSNAIPKLRKCILNLAVRGKLVEPNPNDESADTLLDAITREKEKLIETGVIKKQGSSRDNLNKTPFVIPKTWRWSQISKIGILNPRNFINDYSNVSFIPMRLIPSKYGSKVEYEVRRWGDIKKGYTHFAEGDVGVAKITPCFENGKSTVFRDLCGGVGSGTTELYIVRPILVDPDYVLIFLKSPYFIETGIRIMTGTAGQKRLPKTYISNVPLPLPPLPEQKRIVTKVNDLMAHCDQFEETQIKRDSNRRVFTFTSFASLNKNNADLLEFRERAKFVRANFDRLTNYDDQINCLRQTVIDMAVSGRLVEQDPNEEQASKLLDEFAVEKCSRIDRGEMKLGKAMSEIELTPFSIPPGWMWLPLGETGHIFNGNSTNVETKNRLAKIREGYPYIMTRDVGYGFDSINYDSGFKVSTNDIRFKVARPFSVLVCAEGGSAGRKIGMTDRAICFGNKLLVNEMWEGINSYFLLLVYMSSYFFDEFESRMSGVIPGISISKFKKVPFPLPPKLEQHRIVKKVNELMMCCEKLETALVTRQNTKASLLNSVFHEVLSSVGDNLNKLHS